MGCAGTSNCTCGCCTGIAVLTPQGEKNLPGLPAISYRTGTWATFKDSMLARLSSSDYPALSRLKTRDDDDFSIALLDASAVVLDILTFYQERLANESYLRAATQLRSLTELSRLIGYEPAPGVSASVYLAFSLKAATGLPSNPSTPAITIPQGTQVQSVPTQGQTPQTFETSVDILAKADWNALPIQTGVPWTPSGPNFLYLAGTTTQLNPGDALLILGVERETSSSSTPNEQWNVVILNKVVTDTVRNLTYVAWDQPLTHLTGTPGTWTVAKVFALRQKAALFGNNAPNPNLFTKANATGSTSLPNLIDDTTNPSNWSWKLFFISSSNQIDLDASYPKIVVGSWFALVANGKAQLYKVVGAFSISRADFAMSAKATELGADLTDSNIGKTFPLQGTLVLAQSEQLTVPEQPFNFPLYGTILDLEELRPDLINIKAVAISGKSQRLSVNSGVTTLEFQPDDGSAPLKLNPGDLVTIIDPNSPPLPLDNDGAIPDWSQQSAVLNLRVADGSGRTGTVSAPLTDFTLAPSASSDPVVQEFALVSSVSVESSQSPPHTRIQLKSNLLNCYDRAVTTVNANVGLATNGRSVSEVLGNGSASTPNQSFSLKQSLLTFVQAPTPTGRQSTLQVTANGVAWKEMPTLYQQGPSQQVFEAVNQADGTTEVLFGDGVEGATLPTGQNNVHANYRVGSGLAGNVGAGAITTLVDRPLGVSGVTNPQAATGGQDPQSVNDIRSNAPLSVLTLGRAVSITDYQNYASTFAGIAKAYAIWIPTGPGRGVFITVAGAGGAALPPGNPTLGNLVASLQDYGNPLIPINAVSFLETLFSISADLRIDPAFDKTAVQSAVRQALAQNYSFANRNFGQGVSADEVAAFIQAVPGVIAVNVTSIQVGPTSTAGDITSGQYSLLALNNWLSQTVTLTRLSPPSPTRVCAFLPVANPDSLPQPAEILVLDPDPTKVALGVMV
ncbi:MAG TPA: putative baseplate assembly protein [Candidatus Angelobacter sp.]